LARGERPPAEVLPRFATQTMEDLKVAAQPPVAFLGWQMEDVKVAVDASTVYTDESALKTTEAHSKHNERIITIFRRFVAPGVALSLVLIFVIVSIIDLKALENLHTNVDDMFMDLRRTEPEMKVSFDMSNPTQMHELQIRGMTCDLLVYESEQDKHLLGKLVSDDESVSKPGRHRLSRETTLQQPDTDLLADLMAGRSQYTKADIDCNIKTVIKLWGHIPLEKSIRVVTKLGGAVADKPANDKPETDKPETDKPANDNKLTARMVDYGISFPSVTSAALDSTAEITFHDGHALGLLFRTLVEETNTFTVHMPEAAYRMNTNFLGSITKTTDSTSDEKEEASNDNSNNNNNNPKRESSLEIKSIKLHAHNARVTKDDVDVQSTGDVVVRMPVTVDVSCESPDCMWINLPSVLRAYKTVRDTFKDNMALDTIAETLQLNGRRRLLQQNWLADFFDSDADDLVIDDFLGFYGELNMRFSFDDFMGTGDDQSNVGAKVIGKLDDWVFDAAVHATVTTDTKSSGFYDGKMNDLLAINGQAHSTTDMEFGVPWMPSAVVVNDLLEIEVRDARLEVSTSADNMETTNRYSASIDKEFTLALAKADSPRSGLDSFLFATTSGLTLAPFELGGNYDNVALATAMGGDEFNMWFLTEAADPFFQTRWERDSGDVMSFAGAMAAGETNGRAIVTVTQQNTDMNAENSGRIDTKVHGADGAGFRNSDRSFDLSTTGSYATGTAVVDYVNVTFAGDVVYSEGGPDSWEVLVGDSNTLAGSVNMTSGSLVQDSNSPDLDVGATGQLSVDADVYTMSLGVTHVRYDMLAQNDDGGAITTRLHLANGANVFNLTTNGTYETGLVLGMPTDYMATRGDVCTEQCSSSNNGDCDDGGPGSQYSSCGLGSDCADCSRATVVDYANVTFMGDILSSGDLTAFAGGVNLTGGSLFQESSASDLDFGATGHLNVDADAYTMSLGVTNTQDSGSDTMALDATGQLSLNADVYTMSLGVASGSAPRTDYSDRRNNVCTDDCMRANDGVCTDGGLGASESYYDTCDLGTDCTDCSALRLTYTNVTFVIIDEYVNGESASIGMSFTLTTNSGDNEFIDPLVHTELRLVANAHLDEDYSVSVTVGMNDKLRQDDKQGNFEIRVDWTEPNPHVAFHFDFDVAHEDDGKYTVSTDMTLADDQIVSVGVVSNSNAGVLNVQVSAPESFVLSRAYKMTLETDYGISGSTDNRLQIDMLHQVGDDGCCNNLRMTLAVDLEMESSRLGGMINDLSVDLGLWKNEDFATSVPAAMYSMNVAATTNAERAMAKYGLSQDVTMRMGMSWDKSKAGMSAAVNVAKVDLKDMGQFEDNSMSMQVRSFDAEDSCVVDLQMCAEANNANNVLSFNFDATGEIRDNIRGSMTVRGAEYSADYSSAEVLYVDSTSNYTRTSEKILGVDIGVIPAGDTVRMQMAVNMADMLALDEAYMRVQTSGDDVASDTTLESMNSLSGAGGGDTFPEQLVAAGLVGQCSLSTGDQPACPAVATAPTAAAPTTAAPTGSPTRAPSIAPTSSPTFSGVFDVTATVAFSTLEISAFTNTTFDTQFRSAYLEAVAAEAEVSVSQVAIVSISAGSVNVATVVTFDSLDAGGDIAQAEAKAERFVAKLTTTPADVFKSSTAVNFESFGVTVTNVQKTMLQSRTAAPTVIGATTNQTPTTETTTSASSTSSSISIVLFALVLVLASLLQ